MPVESDGSCIKLLAQRALRGCCALSPRCWRQFREFYVVFRLTGQVCPSAGGTEAADKVQVRALVLATSRHEHVGCCGVRLVPLADSTHCDVAMTR